MKDCFGLHGHSAFGSVANKISGVGRKSATSGGLTTDLVYWLQAGKTVDILRCAAKSTDLLPPSALPRLLRSLRLADYRCQSADADLPPVRLPNPCRLRRHPLSGELPASRPVAPVIVLPLWMLMVLLVVVIFVGETNRSTGAGVVFLLLVLLLYMEI